MNRLVKITHVAIRFQGKIYSLPQPNRHSDVIKKIAEDTDVQYVDSRDEDQGFLDENGYYLNRKQALSRALINNQVKDKDNIRCNMLFSEDLW